MDKKNFDILIAKNETDSQDAIKNILDDNEISYIHIYNYDEIKEYLAEDADLSNFKGDSLTPDEKKLELKLYEGLKKNQFQLFYQPVMNIQNDSLHGFEALIRWITPEDGMISPDDFIPVAEKSPIIIPLGYWIIEEAVKQLSLWNKKFGLDLPIKIGINLSSSQFIDQNLSESIIKIMQKYNMKHDNFVFEITETAFMEDTESANISLLKLKSEGFQLYLDDFGTGYSSLTYLLHFPVDTIKIDKSFVSWMDIDEQSEQIVLSIINMAHNMKMKVVAEGAEKEEHIQVLKENGCNYIQGYFYSKPLKFEDAEKYIEINLKKLK